MSGQHLTAAEKGILHRELRDAITAAVKLIGTRQELAGVCFDCYCKVEIRVLVEALAFVGALLAVDNDGNVDTGATQQIFAMLANALATEIEKRGAEKLVASLTPKTVM